MIFLHEFESFESKNYQTEPGWKSCITLCRSWPTFRRCLRWMTISLTTRLEASGESASVCVCLCVCFIIRGGYKTGHNRNGLVFVFRRTRSQTHKDLGPRTDARSVTTPTTWNRHNELCRLQNICQSLSWNTDKTIPRERDKSPTRPRGQTRLALSETQSLSLSELRLSWASKPPV